MREDGSIRMELNFTILKATIEVLKGVASFEDNAKKMKLAKQMLSLDVYFRSGLKFI